jgi:hypothetical protein
VPIRDILQNNVKEKLKRDEVVASMTVRLIRTVEIARIARTAGFDTLYVDIEHSSFSLDTCGQICMAALEAGIAPFVRVPANTPDYVSGRYPAATVRRCLTRPCGSKGSCHRLVLVCSPPFAIMPPSKVDRRVEWQGA